MNVSSSRMTLPNGYALHWFRIDDVLGQGAFGITYLAHDINLDRQVAIKEYFPTQFSTRNSQHKVEALSEKDEADFNWGLSRFISEARTLTHFEHPNLVKVSSVFEMNNTAYMVMQYEHGKSLQQILKSRKTLTESELTKILFPLLDGMEVMHAKGFVHRDIKPGNIFIRTDGTPVLLDFGSARQTRAMDSRSDTTDLETLTTLVSPGFAPIEQYGTRSERQGPWTDIYGMGATLYKAVVGVKPTDSILRSEAITHDQKDALQPLVERALEGYSTGFLNAIDKALSFTVQERPKDVAEWRQLFGVEKTSEVEPLDTELLFELEDAKTQKLERSVAFSEQKTEQILEQTLDSEAETIEVHDEHQKTPVNNNRWKLFSAGMVSAALIIIFGMNLLNRTIEQPPVSTTADVETLAAETVAAPQVTEDTGLDQSQVQLLLIHAEEDMAALRLTSPVNNNAFDKYLKVLSIDESNAAALDGIQAISDKYVAMANRAIDGSKYYKADSYLKKAQAITPDAEPVVNAHARLIEKRLQAESMTAAKQAQAVDDSTTTADKAIAAREPEEKNDTFWDQVKQWQQDQTKKLKSRKPANDNEEFKQRIRDAL